MSALFWNQPRTLSIADDLKIAVICLTEDGCWAGAKRVHVLVILGLGPFVYLLNSGLLLSLCFLPTFL